MKPGSSDRCKAKLGHLRCAKRKGHETAHAAKTGKTTTQWTETADV